MTPESHKGAGTREKSEYLSDAAVVEEVKNGDRSLFGVLIRRYQERLYNYLYRFTHDRAGSEDLVSETLVRAYFHLGKCHNPQRFSSWLFAIAHNTGINHWKKATRERQQTISLENMKRDIADTSHLDMQSAAIQREEAVFVEKALAQLEEKYRYPLLLFYHENFSYDEIGEILALPLNTVKTHIFRAKKQLAAKLVAARTNEDYRTREPILARSVSSRSLPKPEIQQS